MKLILLDVEGTTTSIDFVAKVLFPYSAKKMQSFVEKNISSPKYKTYFESLSKKIALPLENYSQATHQITNYLLELIKKDVKDPDLKSLQGFIWEEGYLNNEIKGHIYPDVKDKLHHWVNKGIKLGIYSSGSVKAQKLLFRNSIYGDLDKLFSFNFDLEVGAKKNFTSYAKIADQVDLDPTEILFISDSLEEVTCAQQANYKVCCITREGSPSSSIENCQFVSSFDEIKI